MGDRAKVGIRRARAKYDASGAEALGFARPNEYSNIEGRERDGLYLGPDPDGGWSIVQKGRVTHRFDTAAQARAFYKQTLAGPDPARRFVGDAPKA
jgi:hypothetical protein